MDIYSSHFHVTLAQMAATVGFSVEESNDLAAAAIHNACDVPHDEQESCAIATMKMYLDDPDMRNAIL